MLGYLDSHLPDCAAAAKQIAILFPKLSGITMSGDDLQALHVEALSAFPNLTSIRFAAVAHFGPATLRALGKLLRRSYCTNDIVLLRTFHS